MILIRNLGKNIHYEPLFKDINLTIHRGDRIGIVGPNGSGKSTLLKIIAQIETPDDGEVILEKERVSYLEQVIPEDEQVQTIASYLRKYKPHQIDEVFSSVGLPNLNTELTLLSLSGGQKTKLALARILLERPTTLLLDEPTNHLDAEGITILEDIITSRFGGAVVIISHDRTFLNKCVNVIVEFDPQTKNISTYQGNYDKYLAERIVHLEHTEALYKVQQVKKEQLEARLKEAQLAKSIATRALHKRLEREIYSQEIAKPNKRNSLPKLQLAGEVANGKLIARFSDVTKRIGDNLLLNSMSFEIRGKEHVLLTGENGSGKTTITRLITGQLAADEGHVVLGPNVRIGYFDQEHSTLNPNATVEQEIFDSIGDKITNVRGLLAVYGFFGDDRLKPIRYLSSGEQVRLMLAKLAHEEYELLILDEPTNHLDITSREILENSLQSFTGSLLVISHDRYFLDKIGIQKILTIKNKKITESIA